MKVLMFGWEFPPNISGGLGTACFGLTKEMAKLNIGITFVLPKLADSYDGLPIRVIGPQSAAKEIRRIEKVENEDHLLRKYKIDSALHPYMDKETYQKYLMELDRKRREDKFFDKKFFSLLDLSGNYGPNLMMEVSRYAGIGRFLASQESFDLIHAHDWMTFQAAIEAKKASGKPLIVHVHATEFDRTGNNINPEIYCIEKYGMDMADKIIAVSERTKGLIVQKYGQDPNKVVVVYNGVEKEKISPVGHLLEKSAFKNDKIVLFLGRITVQKGPEFFLKAANLVLKKIKNVRFVMAGSGDLSKQMIEQMAELRLTDRFHFTGFLNAPERDRLFAMSDLFVMPSVSEPFGITPLEAMRYDVPVIISKQSGIGEVLDAAIKVDFWDVDEMAKQIIEVLSNKKLRQKLIDENRRSLRDLTWSNAASDVQSVYNGVLK